jgi:uncharacterized membrane protein
MEGNFPPSKEDLQEGNRARDGHPWAEDGGEAEGNLIARGAGVCYASRESSPVEGMSMAFCKACGQEIGTATFCPKCGASQGAAAAPASALPAAPAASPTEGLQENVAGLLCYLLGWVTGLVFLLIDKRPWVKFHAAQSIVVFGGLTVLRIALAFMGGIFGGFFGWGIFALLGLVGVILWVLLMIKAYQHETFRVPIAADIADSIAK